MERDWERLGEALQAARRAADLSQEDMATELGVGRSTIQKIERGHEFEKPTLAIRAYARRVGWTEGSVDQVLAGGGPNHIHVASAELGAARSSSEGVLSEGAVSRLPVRIVDAIENEGALVDTAVIPLGNGGNMVVVVKGTPGATPDEIKAALDAWLRAQPQLQELSTGNEQAPAANGA